MTAPTGDGGRGGGGILLWVLFLLALAALLGMGSWQVERLAWKEALISEIAGRIHADPLPLSEIERRFPDIEYMPVRMSGRFVHGAERHFFTTLNGMTGYNVYTPLILGDGRAVFVNRGFVPFERKLAAGRMAGQVEGEVDVVGLARRALTEKPSWAVPDNDVAGNIFYSKDLRAMSASSGLDPSVAVLGFFVDADAAQNPGGLPVGGGTFVDLPNNHLQYAVTWFGLALALCGVFGYRQWSLRRAKP